LGEVAVGAKKQTFSVIFDTGPHFSPLPK